MTDSVLPAELVALARRVVEENRAAGRSIAVAESCTGGLVAAAITEVPGASDVLDRAFITYSNEAKMELLGVKAGTLEAHGAVSEEVAREMADGALANSPADIAVSVTGIAGPGPSEHKPEGRVCFGVARKGRATRVETVEFGPRGRANVREASMRHALEMLAEAME